MRLSSSFFSILRAAALRPDHWPLNRLIIILALVCCAYSPALGFAPDDDLTARAAVLMDAATGKVIYQKEADLHLPPASTTKIMTAILTLESGRSLTEKF